MKAIKDRYEKMIYRRLGNSGIKLPVISLGLWNNFGSNNSYEECTQIVWKSFNHGITHFDLANNYGPPAGHAEMVFGKILKDGFIKHRDEIIVSTKAGYDMWEGPYGDFGSRKYLIASLDQSLERMGLKYVDIFYHHRFDPETSLKETMLALRDIVLSGKALYVGLSNYTSSQLAQAYKILDSLNVPYIVTQPKYSMLDRTMERDNILTTQDNTGGGTVVYSALEQGLLSNKYIDSVPKDSRAMNTDIVFLSPDRVDDKLRDILRSLKVIADKRNQTITQLALCWTLRDPRLTSILLGIRTIEQLKENILVLDNLELTSEEVSQIELILS